MTISASVAFIHVGGLSLHIETFGDRDRRALLLIMGNSAPGLVWPDRFCAALAERGLFVIRFDQRDTGLSSYVDYDTAPYDLTHLADDCLGILDGLGVSSASLAGLSQGGVLASLVALRAPDRVDTLTLLMSSLRLGPKNAAFAGLPIRAGELSRPALDYIAQVIALNRVPPGTEAEAARQFVENFRLAKGPRSSFCEVFWAELGTAVARIPARRSDGLAARMANNSNHRKAQMATRDISPEELSDLRLPVLVIHGGGDPIFPQDHAEWTVAHLPNARLKILPEMGHALDPGFFDEIVGLQAAFLAEHPPR